MYSAICQICRNKFTARAKTTKYCSACVSKAKAEAALHRKEQLNRPLTTDTEFLICLYTYRGDSISRIATDLNRSEEDVQSILNEAKANLCDVLELSGYHAINCTKQEYDEESYDENT